MPPSKNVKISQRQQEIMLDYMLQHKDFAFGRCNGPLGLGKKEFAAMWETLALTLNAVGAAGVGATKCAFKWKASWVDWRGKATAKANRLEAQRNGILSIETVTPSLSQLEEKLMAFIGHESLEEVGHGLAMKPAPNSDEADVLDASSGEHLQFEIADDVIIIEEGDDPLTGDVSGIITEAYEQAGLDAEKPRPRYVNTKKFLGHQISRTKPYYKQESTFHEKATGKIETVQQENLKVSKEILQKLTEIASATRKNAAFTARMTIALETIAARI